LCKYNDNAEVDFSKLSGSIWLLSEKKKRDNEDREKDGNKIVIDNNIQNKMIVFFSCLIIVDKIK
jgi:hypothetical protein